MPTAVKHQHCCIFGVFLNQSAVCPHAMRVTQSLQVVSQIAKDKGSPHLLFWLAALAGELGTTSWCLEIATIIADTGNAHRPPPAD
jgi:hypothetical protein